MSNVKSTIIYGASGLGKEIMIMLEEENKPILGFIDQRFKDIKQIHGYPVLGDITWFDTNNDEIDVIIAIGNVSIRKEIFNQLSKHINLSFPNLISKNALISKYVNIGQGNIISKNVIITVDVTIGDFNIINFNTSIAHDSTIGNFNTINPNSIISGNVILGDEILIGTGSTIIEKKIIASNATIGAGSVVIKNIKSGLTIFGNPARPIN